jgi:Fe-S-cluster containining protein
MEINLNICQNCKESCCSYKGDELEYTPTFTKEEVEKIRKKLDGNFFSPMNKSKTVFDINAVKSKKSPNLYLCPFFDEDAKKCQIYDLRALDCRLFPFTFVNNKGKVYLARVDGTVCSYMQNARPEVIEELKKRVSEFIKKENAVETLKKYPELILDDEDVVLLEEINLR